jgi:methylated-DNA-[protein]-cysteine S-methyltransferase
MTTRTWTEIESPVGPLRLVAEDAALVAVDFLGEMPDGPGEAASVRLHRTRGRAEPDGSARDDSAEVLVRAAGQLAAYFAGERETFDLPLDLRGTPFQQQVWAELRRIPYGTTATYGEIAARLGRTGHGARAVGVANGRNPIPVIVPCHRVVGASGAMTGYGGGMDRKRTLLDLEGALALRLL